MSYILLFLFSFTLSFLYEFLLISPKQTTRTKSLPEDLFGTAVETPLRGERDPRRDYDGLRLWVTGQRDSHPFPRPGKLSSWYFTGPDTKPCGDSKRGFNRDRPPPLPQPYDRPTVGWRVGFIRSPTPVEVDIGSTWWEVPRPSFRSDRV